MNKNAKIINALGNDAKKTFNNRLIVSIFISLYWIFFIVIVWISKINASGKESLIESFPWLQREYKGIFAYISNFYLLPLVFGISFELNKLCFVKPDLSTVKKQHYRSFIFLIVIGSLLLIFPSVTHITIYYYYYMHLPIFLKLKQTTVYLLVLIGTIFIFIILISILIKITHLNDFKKIISLIVLSIVSYFGLFAISFISIIKSWVLIFYIAIVISFSDIFAYLSGLIFGRTKMAKNISPKKTWEGFFIGLVITLLLSMLLAFIFSLGGKDFRNELTHISLSSFDEWVYYLFMIAVIIFLSICSTIGDLFFSYFKRINNIKDFSSLLKSHGGILDRFDSWLFTSSAYVVFLFIIIGVSSESQLDDILNGVSNENLLI